MKLRTLALAITVVSAPAFALEQGETRFNGFGTAGVSHLGGESDGHGYGITGQTTDGWRGDQLSKLGGQFQYGVTDKVGVTVQATAKAEQDEYKANLEWLYASWQATDNLMLRVGRLRTPVYMYSETLDVGFTYPWLRLPDEVYSQVQLSNYEGADAVYTLPLSFGSMTFQAAGGQAKNRDYFSLDDQYDIDYSKIFAANVSLATNDYGTVRVGYVESDLKIDVNDAVVTPFGRRNVTFNQLDGNKGKFTSVGYQYDNGTWLTSNEWTRRVIEGDQQTSVEAFYLMAGRRFGDFLAHVTYAQLDAEGRQSSWTYGLNYNLTPSVILKGEYKRVNTSGGYSGTFVRTSQEAYNNALNAQTGFFGSPARNYDGDVISVGLDFVF
ncbi:hypothetical protein [Pseudomonas sp. RIT-PI-S]|uniref:hypothetical protein n=1 Tax=Pseudomonas sp. RIT-PI-S TaxID=3035295 RepID=UPI0021D8A200|nr:hypothetical protein [Pseudomonas sp. RIT-PI-S]